MQVTIKKACLTKVSDFVVSHAGGSNIHMNNIFDHAYMYEEGLNSTAEFANR